jgi:arylsulfatase A-like enzyme
MNRIASSCFHALATAIASIAASAVEPPPVAPRPVLDPVTFHQPGPDLDKVEIKDPPRGFRPNILFLCAEQQRADTIAALGAKGAITPHMDRLVKEGVAFTRAYCTTPSCVASRHAILTGMAAPPSGVFGFDQWTGRREWTRHLREAGYHLASIGKVHYQPHRDAPGWWHERIIVENKNEGPTPSIHGGTFIDDWSIHLEKRGIPRLGRRDRYPDYDERLCAFTWEYAEDDHADMFIGNHAESWLRHRTKYDKPWMLWVGFVGPHEPYDPPKRFLDMHKDSQYAEPNGSYAEMMDPDGEHPEEHRQLARFFMNLENDARIRPDKATPERIREMRRHYHANITLIDERIGGILAALEARGELDRTIIVFTSDHGDSLLDHGLPFKWTPDEGSIGVSLIVRYPARFPGGRVTKRLTSIYDVVPALLEEAGIGVPTPRTWTPCTKLLRGEPNPEPFPEHAFVCHGSDPFIQSTYVAAVGERWKYVTYLNSNSRELYDLQNDPGETRNLAKNPTSENAGRIRELEETAWHWFASTVADGRHWSRISR